MISRNRGTYGARWLPDDLDSNTCHLRGCPDREGVLRLNVDGIWFVLCERHRRNIIRELETPRPAPGHEMEEP